LFVNTKHQNEKGRENPSASPRASITTPTMTLCRSAAILAPVSKQRFNLPSTVPGLKRLMAPQLSNRLSTNLFMAAGPVLSNYSSIAGNYFTGTRVPAALIAGSSLGALFIMVNKTKDPEQRDSKLRFSVLSLYHFLSLASLCLSLNVIVTATTASNALLIGEYNPMAVSALDFLRREVYYEYLMTKWCFYVSIVCFLNAVSCRALIEFDFLRKERSRSASFVVCSILALVGHVLHLVNDSLYVYPNLWVMTIGLGKVRILCLFQKHIPHQINDLPRLGRASY
jgi:hypothetical protein